MFCKGLMEADMKRYIFIMLLALVFLVAGAPTAFSQTDAAADRGNAAPGEALPHELKGQDVKDTL